MGWLDPVESIGGSADGLVDSTKALEQGSEKAFADDWNGALAAAKSAAGTATDAAKDVASTSESATNTVARGQVNYGELDALGRPTGVTATITEDMIGTGTEASRSIRPPGFQGGSANQARGHLLGRQLGGSGTEPRNLVTLQQRPANTPAMSTYEGRVRAAVESGQTVQYSSTPVYDGTNPVPRAITLEAQGSGGYRLGISVLNPPGNPGLAIRASANGLEFGGKVPPFDRVSRSSLGAKEGSLGGAAAGAAVSLIQLAATGKLDPHNLEQVAKGTAEGVVIGAIAGKGEQFVTSALDRTIGVTVQNSATKLAGTAAGAGGADTAGVVARTLASRVAGSTVVGAVITTGISAWENRAGLMHGDSKAIGNVVADTAVGAGSVAAATAAGAAIGSVVPVAGTAVGAVAGLAVGLGIAYGAQISGVRDAIAGGATHAVDGIKSAAKSVASGVSDAAKSIGSGVSHAANSVAHFFGF
jgi:hypothetical protein